MLTPPKKLKNKLFHYRAVVTDVYDGDTVTLAVDLGFHMNMVEARFRLDGIDTPELKGMEREKGLLVRDIVREKLLGKGIIIRTNRDKTGSFGRYLTRIFVEVEGGYLDLNDWLLEQGHAEPYEK